MSEVLLAVIALAVLAAHVAASRSWAREEHRLVTALLAPTPAAAAAALAGPAVVRPPAAVEAHARRPAPIGGE